MSGIGHEGVLNPARRRRLGAGTAAMLTWVLGMPVAPAQAAKPPSRGANPWDDPPNIRWQSRARYSLAADFMPPPKTQSIVPWSVTSFQFGHDFALQVDGRVLVNTHGLYEIVMSSDWEANAHPETDIDIRQIGLRRQRAGQPDFPTEEFERLAFVNTPGSDPPQMARYLGSFAPPVVGMGAVVSVDVTVSPPGIVGPGDLAFAGHTGAADGLLPASSLAALIIHAKVIAPDTVRVSLYNPTIAEGIAIGPGTLKVDAMSASTHRGRSADTWQVLHSPSVELKPGDKVCGMAQHHIAGSRLQATQSSYLQIDRLA
jgi:hypothetical protein